LGREISVVYEAPQNRVTKLQEAPDDELSIGREDCLERLNELVRLGVVRRAKRKIRL
jgi:DNA-binding Lrp family transcriptional regulator